MNCAWTSERWYPTRMLVVHLESPGRAIRGRQPKQYRAVATRYDKLAASYHSWLVLAALLLWLPA
jgi:transposase